ncbi:ATP-binding protein, partial [Streptomyces sp. NPDC059627]
LADPPPARPHRDACPSLTVVATSREPLGVAGEALFPVDPMTAEEAAELFALRASMLDQSCDREEAARSDDVLALCRRLDGLPLAVELAAAHTRVLSVPEIARRLDDRFSLLVKGERTAPARHRTLRAVLDWSYALLSTSEQLVLGELALRADGCSLEDAERTGLAEPGETGPAEVLRLLGQLVDKSLLFTVRTSDGGTRFRMLETVREYALARLAADGGLAAAEERFVAWTSGFVRKGHKGMPSAEQALWSRRVSEESANLRAASELMIRNGRAGQALVLESTLGYFWYILGREEEGIDRLTRTLDAYDTERQGAGPDRPLPAEEEWALCYVLVWLAWLNHVCGRHGTALRYERRHTDTWRTARNPDVAVVGPVWEALHARLSAEEGWEEQFAAADESVAGTQFGWDRVALHYAWSTYCLHTGDTDGAREHALTGIEVSKDIDDPITLAVCLTACGDAEESAGRREAAGELWGEAADVLESRGARSRWAYRVLRLAFLDVGEDRIESADRRLAEVETIAADLVSYDLRAAVANLRGLALAGQCRLDEAERLFREVWSSRTAPRSRRAVAGIGLASCAPSDRVLRAVDELLDGLADPPTRGAVGLLLAEAGLPGRAPRGYVLHERLARSPSVLAAFS